MSKRRRHEGARIGGGTEEERQGSVYYQRGEPQQFIVTDRGGIYPISLLDKFAIRKADKKPGDKKTPEEERAESAALKDTQYISDKNLMPYPVEVKGLEILRENCSFFDACVRQIAKDVTGQGYDLKLREGVDKGDEEKKKAIARFLEDPNRDEDSITDVLERLVDDWGWCGWWAMEVARDTAGAPNGIYQLPAQTIKVHRENEKYCQVRFNKYKWFKKYGAEGDIDDSTGEPLGTKRAANDAGDEIEEPDLERRAHELIFYRNYYIKSDYYGVPNVLPAVGSIEGLVGIRDYNLAFFTNYGIPAAIVTLTGKWKKGAAKLISDFIDVEVKASNNSHKTILVCPPQGGTIEWKPLITEVKEGHFKLYFKQLRDEVLVCYRMPPYRVGIVEIGSLGGSTAEESSKIYNDSVVKPLQRVLNHIISQRIIKDGFGTSEWVFELRELDVRNLDAETERVAVQFGMGVLTRPMVADRLGLPLIPDDDPYRDSYFISHQYREVGTEPAETGVKAREEAYEGLKAKLAEIKARREEAARKAAEEEERALRGGAVG